MSTTELPNLRDAVWSPHFHQVSSVNFNLSITYVPCDIILNTAPLDISICVFWQIFRHVNRGINDTQAVKRVCLTEKQDTVKETECPTETQHRWQTL
jgi:hypothetical protein